MGKKKDPVERGKERGRRIREAIEKSKEIKRRRRRKKDAR